MNKSSFSEALLGLKNGQRWQRNGWNGKGMLVILVPEDAWSTSIGPGIHQLPGAHRLPWLALKTYDNGLVPWIASQTDLLANDWQMIE